MTDRMPRRGEVQVMTGSKLNRGGVGAGGTENSDVAASSAAFSAIPRSLRDELSSVGAAVQDVSDKQRLVLRHGERHSRPASQGL